MEIKLNTAYSSQYDNVEYPIYQLADGSFLCIAYSNNHNNYYTNIYTEEDFIKQGFEESDYINYLFEDIKREDIGLF